MTKTRRTAKTPTPPPAPVPESFRSKLDRNAYTTTLPYASLKKDPDVNAAYQADSNRLADEFRRDLEAEYGTDELPESVRDATYRRAYEEGHAYGFSEIANCYIDIAEHTLAVFEAGRQAALAAPPPTPPGSIFRTRNVPR
jgi:hypothetical protein